MKPSLWGDWTFLQVSKLDSVFQKKVHSIAQRNYGPPRKDIQQKALPELAPEYMIRLAEDFKKNLID